MKEQSLFLKLFIVLTLFIIIPVVFIAIVLSYKVVNNSENEISKSAIGKLKVAQNISELIADNLQKDALEISIGKNLNELHKLHKYREISENTEGIMKLFDAQNELLKYVRSNSIIHSVYFYIEGSDFIVTSNKGVILTMDFADTGWVKEYEKCQNIQEGSSWLPTRTVNYSKENKTGELGASNKVITYLYILKPYTNSVRGVLVFNIYEESIRNLINSSNTMNEEFIEIISPAGNVISHMNNEIIGTNIKFYDYIDEILAIRDTEGYIINSYGEDRELISYFKSNFNDWIFIGTFSLDELMGKANSLKKYIIYISLVLMVAGVLAAYIISRKLYDPLRKLVQDIKNRKGIDIKSGESEMAILSKAFDSLIQQRLWLFDILERNAESLRDAYIIDMLQGKVTGRPNGDLAGITFQYDFFVCGVILIDNYQYFIDSYLPEQRKYIKMLIIKVSEDLINERHTCVGILYEKHKIVLVINAEKQIIEVVKMKEIFKRLQVEISKILDYSISVGIGNWVNGVQAVNESLDNALEALKQKIIRGFGSINFWEEQKGVKQSYFYPYIQEKHIFNNINAGLKDKMIESVSEFVKSIKNNEGIHYDNIILIFSQLIGNTIRFLMDMHCNISAIFGSDYNIYQKMSSLETVDCVGEWLQEMYFSIIEYLHEDKNSDKNYFEMALDYIHKNYHRDIVVSSIAVNIGISYSYLRRIFKENTGNSVVHYINSLRISESKRILRQTNQTISEISNYLGYNNDQSFTRFFKLHEGITPSEFRLLEQGRR